MLSHGLTYRNLSITWFWTQLKWGKLKESFLRTKADKIHLFQHTASFLKANEQSDKVNTKE